VYVRGGVETLQCWAMENADVRRRVQAALEAARREAGERRERADAAARDYTTFLTERAVPVFRQIAAVLAAEGRRFQVSAPAESVRLSAEGAGEDFIELALDATQDPPRVIGRTSRGRGRRSVTAERFLRDGADVADLTESDVLEFAATELVFLLAR
jgi:hypothetical protein